MSPETQAPEQMTVATPNSLEDFNKIVEETAKTQEDIIETREMALRLGGKTNKLGKVAIFPEGGEPFEVTAIGSEKFSELVQTDPEVVAAAMAVNSDSWQNENK